MPRSFSYSALTLRVRQSGESNREAWFLTAGEGLVKATVFGGARSRLRSQVAPYHEGRLIVYHNPVKDYRKVTDFEVQSWRPGIRELWERTAAAGALAETILFSHGGGGNWPEALKLAGTVLDILSGASTGACPRIIIYFLWHWIQILGIKPELSHCALCNKIQNEAFLWYSGRKEAIFCEKCRSEQGLTLRIGPGSRQWLANIEKIPPEALETYPVDALSLDQAKALSTAILENALGKRLATWDGI